MSIADLPADQVAAERPQRRRGLNRRAVLGAAVAGGVGVAAMRLWGGEALQRIEGAIPGHPALAGRGDWNSPLGSEQARVTQLLRRATLGAGPAELEKAFSDGFGKTVDRLVETKYASPPAFGNSSDPSRFARLNVAQLQQWWLDHMLQSPTPFAERMTLFWHGHFTSDYRKVGLQTPFIYWQNLTWRDMALTDLRSILKRVTADPAMLRYLDLATSTGASPNENYSRELMELFAMGAGNYTEDDVRAAAKGLAGWAEPRPTGTADIVLDPKNNVVRKLPVYDQPASGTFVPQRAYKGAPFMYLGKTAQWNTDMVIDQILTRPATAPFIVGRVLEQFVMQAPPKDYVNRLAGGFKKSGYDVKTLMRDVFNSPEFASQAAYRSLVKSPTEFMVHALRALGAESQARLVMAGGSNMGQVLFDPPDVGGWPNNEAWISSNTVLARVNFATTLLNAVKPLPSAADAHRQHLDDVLSPQTAAALNQASDDRTRWLLVLASPEFQLK
ncbi:MAG TPA: DUF1800 domain-containing protein [Candidatus Dormibacteraeota bacterium]